GLRGRPPAERELPAQARPARPADPRRVREAPVPRAGRRLLRDGRQPGGVLRQPVLGPGPGQHDRRQGRPAAVAARPPRLARVLTAAPPYLTTGPPRRADGALILLLLSPLPGKQGAQTGIREARCSLRQPPAPIWPAPAIRPWPCCS